MQVHVSTSCSSSPICNCSQRLTRPQGRILLPGCSITILEERAQPASPTSEAGCPTDEAPSAVPSPTPSTPRRASSRRRKVVCRPNAFLIHTASGVDYYLQAASNEERDVWMADIQQHTATCSSAHLLISMDRRSNTL